MTVTDIHSHHAAPYPEGIISVSPEGVFTPVPGQYYSVGVHPWDTAGADDAALEARMAAVERLAAEPWVAAIGECGIDMLRGAPLFRQMNIFKRHVDLSLKVGKPLVIHCVKAHDVVIGMKKELAPGAGSPLWVVHGFRGKPTVARMLAAAGIGMSLGERFNAESLQTIPPELLFAETDESKLTITQIIAALSAAAGTDLQPVIAGNVFSNFLQ